MTRLRVTITSSAPLSVMKIGAVMSLANRWSTVLWSKTRPLPVW